MQPQLQIHRSMITQLIEHLGAYPLKGFLTSAISLTVGVTSTINSNTLDICLTIFQIVAYITSIGAGVLTMAAVIHNWNQKSKKRK